MVATPMKLEDALRFNGYTIGQEDVETFDVPILGAGTIKVPAMRLSTLTWEQPGDPEPWDSFYLAKMPLFADEYRPVLLSHILDRYAGRRISYDTPDEFGRAVRRWLNLHLGPMSELNRLYVSTTVNLPLTTQDATVDSTSTNKSRDAHSDFPQGQLGGNLDFASDATDQVSDATGHVDYQGRMGDSVMKLLAEQRASYLNVDLRVLEAMEPLFLSVFDRSERDDTLNAGYPGYMNLGW
jgi:hypothetical protein